MSQETPVERIGKYSGNKRLDSKTMDERDIDTDQSFSMWLEDVINDPDMTKDSAEHLNTWKEKMAKTFDPTKFNIHLQTQTHVDMAWKWRYDQTRRKGVKSYRKVVRHSEKFSWFRFAASEPLLLQWVKEEELATYTKVQDAVKNGNVELVGGAWVEPDCMLPSGESFVRQRLYGMRFYRDEFNKLPEVEWFLDSFGYNVGLPQILSKSGAKYFWTNKMTWNKITTFPFVNFVWESPDGSQLVTSNFGQMKEVFDRWDKFGTGRYLIKENGKRRWTFNDDYSKLEDNVDKTKICPAVAWFQGKGDGGHGPTHQEVCELYGSILGAKEIGLNLFWSTAQAFFEEVAKYKNDLPIWADEMYLETHQGCMSGQSEVKRHNRRLENLCQTAESLATFVSIFDPTYAYPFDKLEKVWKIVLMNQFHDVLPGSSIPEVYDDTWELWCESDQIINGIIDDALARIKGDSINYPISLHNSLSWTRKAQVFIPVSACNDTNLKLDESGKPPYARLVLSDQKEIEPITCQPVAAEFQDRMMNRPAGWWAVLEIPAYAILHGKLVFEPVQGASLHIQVGANPRITNGITTVDLDPKTGAITKFFANNVNRGENLVYGAMNNLIYGYRDDDKEYPAWNLPAEYWKYPINYAQDTDVQISIQDQGPVFVTLAIKRTLGKSSVTQTLRLFKNDPRLYCSWSADWKEENVMLKVGLDTATKASTVTTDEMYCALVQSTLPNNPADKARYEKIMHKYADMSTSTNYWGIALLNEGKYAFDASGDRIRLTLHRSPQYPTPAAEAWVNEERKIKENESNKVPEFGGMGPISCRWAYYPHTGGALRDPHGKVQNIVKYAAEEFNNPVIVKLISASGSTEYPVIDIYISPNVQITALKRKEWEKSNSLILRVAEICGQKETNVSLILPKIIADKIATIENIDLLERPIEGQLEWIAEGGQIKFTIHQFEIKSFELKLK